MSGIIHKLDLKTTAETNLFLRALWAALRESYGRLGWQFTPRRFGEEKKFDLDGCLWGLALLLGWRSPFFIKR